MNDDEIRDQIEVLERELDHLKSLLKPEKTTQYRTHGFFENAAITVSMVNFKPPKMGFRKKPTLTMVK